MVIIYKNRKDSFITHRAFCDALAEETARLSAASNPNNNISTQSPFTILNSPNYPHNFTNPPLLPWENTNIIKSEIITLPPLSSPFYQEPSSPFQLHHVSKVAPHLSATALLQRAATVGSQPVGNMPSTMMMMDMGGCHVTSTGVSPAEYMGLSTWQKSDRLTRDFLGLTAAGKEHGGGGGDAGSVVDVNVNMNVRNLLTFTGGGFPTTYDRDHSLLLKPHGFGFAEPHSASGTSWGNC